MMTPPPKDKTNSLYLCVFKIMVGCKYSVVFYIGHCVLIFTSTHIKMKNEVGHPQAGINRHHSLPEATVRPP